MREIKFNAWDKVKKVMWYDILMDLESGDMYEDDLSMLEVSIMMKKGDYSRFDFLQYTGLKDKNGILLYEGHVCKGHYFEYGKERRIVGYIKYEFDGYYLIGVNKYEGIKKRLGDLVREVIGNIYENPKLVKVKVL